MQPSIVDHLTEQLVRITPDQPIASLRWVHDGPRACHDHDFYEIFVVVNGRARQQSSRGEQDIQRGDAFVIRPGAWHLFRQCEKLTVYNCLFRVQLLAQQLAWVKSEPNLNYLLFSGPLLALNCGIVPLKLTEPVIAECLDHLSNMPSADPNSTAPVPFIGETIGRFLLFLSALTRGMDTVDFSPRRPDGCMHLLVTEVVQLLESDITRHWRLPELAKRVMCDPSYLTRLCKKDLGMPPIAYLARLRANRAAALLVKTDLSIMEVADQVGWADANYFAKRFRAHFGVNASEFRSQRRAGVTSTPH